MFSKLMKAGNRSTKRLQILFVVVFSFLILIGFQNCNLNKINATSINVESQNSVSSGNGQGYDGLTSGNGQGYDGKIQPDGTFFHWVPNYTCNLSGAAISSYQSAVVYDQAGTYPAVKTDLCGTPQNMQNAFNVESYAFDPSMIYFGGQVYEKTVNQAPNPNGYITLFCKPFEAAPSYVTVQIMTGVNVVVRQKPNDPKYYAEITFGVDNSQQGAPLPYVAYSVAPFAVSHAINQTQTSSVYGAQGFNLNVDLTNPQSVYTGGGGFVTVYTAGYSATINQVQVSAQLNCINQ